MTIEDIMPLIVTVGQLLAQLTKNIIESQHMSDEQKTQALLTIAAQYDETAAKVAARKF